VESFILSDFSGYKEYEEHRNSLNRAQGAADQLLKLWDADNSFTRQYPGTYWQIQRLLHQAAKLGYEAAIGKPHLSSEYGITPQIMPDQLKCSFCKHHYLVYGCESECTRKKAGLPCELEVKEFLE
jgi:hypothetical protein